MASLDIFNNDAFRTSALIDTITDIPRVPTELRGSGLFTEYGISTPTIMLERTGSELSLVPTAPRGAPGQPIKRGPRKLIPLAAVHLLQDGAVLADRVYGVRAFGSETEGQQVQAIVREELAIMKESMDLTLEHMMIGAVKGVVLDADGVTPIWNMYDLFGFTQETLYWDIANASSTVSLKAKIIELKRKIRTSMGGRVFTGVKVYSSEGWFEKFTGHSNMLQAWDRWNNGAFLREDQTANGDFAFAGVQFHIYAGGAGGNDFIEDNFAYAVPTGVPRMFQAAFAPADYMDTVGRNGVPYYAKQERMNFDRGVMLEAQSNPLIFNKYPEAVKRISVAAS